jgi:hypothetical protein
VGPVLPQPLGTPGAQNMTADGGNPPDLPAFAFAPASTVETASAPALVEWAPSALGSVSQGALSIPATQGDFAPLVRVPLAGALGSAGAGVLQAPPPPLLQPVLRGSPARAVNGTRSSPPALQGPHIELPPPVEDVPMRLPDREPTGTDNLSAGAVQELDFPTSDNG